MALSNRFLPLWVLIALLASILVACGSDANTATSNPTVAGGSAGQGASAKVRVLASFYPLYEVVRRVGGDRVDVSNLVAAGSEPHDLELSPRELDNLRNARLVVYVGAGFQPGLERGLETVESPDLRPLDVTREMRLLEGQEDEHADEHAAEGEGEQHPQDPHVWLDPVLMGEIVSKVRDELVRIDPNGRRVYEANARGYQGELEALDGEFRRGLDGCRRKEVVTSHAAFGYLTERYHLEQVPISGISPEAEPSPRRLQEIVRFAREHDVEVIYFETLVDPRVAQTIAREVGAKTMVLNPIEGLTPEEQAQGKDYMDLMRQNLDNLRGGLGCR